MTSDLCYIIVTIHVTCLQWGYTIALLMYTWMRKSMLVNRVWMCSIPSGVCMIILYIHSFKHQLHTIQIVTHCNTKINSNESCPNMKSKSEETTHRTKTCYLLYVNLFHSLHIYKPPPSSTNLPPTYASRPNAPAPPPPPPPFVSHYVFMYKYIMKYQLILK